MPLFAALESRVLAYFAGSLAVHLGFWLAAPADPGRGLAAPTSTSRRSRTRRPARTARRRTIRRRREEEDKPDDGADESGGTGTAMALDEGKMGKKDSDRAEGQYKMQKTQDDPQLARQQAIEQARNAGILGNDGADPGWRVRLADRHRRHLQRLRRHEHLRRSAR